MGGLTHAASGSAHVLKATLDMCVYMICCAVPKQQQLGVKYWKLFSIECQARACARYALWTGRFGKTIHSKPNEEN